MTTRHYRRDDGAHLIMVQIGAEWFVSHVVTPRGKAVDCGERIGDDDTTRAVLAAAGWVEDDNGEGVE